MPAQRLTSRVTVLRTLCTTFVAIVAETLCAEVFFLTSADGTVIEIETNKFSTSTRFVGADAIWLHHSYPMSIDCRPPRGCYAKSQLINYHFRCAPRYVAVVERISMDLNGNIVKHEVFELGGTYELYTQGDLVDSFCGPLPDPADLRDLREQQRPDPGEKPRKK